MQKAIIFHQKAAHTGKLIGKKKKKKEKNPRSTKKGNEEKWCENNCKRKVCVCVSAVWKVIKSKEDPKSKRKK